MSFQQPPLPYPMDALKGYISEEQMQYHYGKHHAGYYAKLQVLLQGRPPGGKLSDVVTGATGPLFHAAAQAWNHTFFWNCMSPAGGGPPMGRLAAAIDRDFGGYAAFKTEFSDAATGLFGAGWTWLACDLTGKLSVQPLGNADTPLKHGLLPLLTLDVWEHAYYVDYRNERPRFVQGFWDVVNWDFACATYTVAKTGVRP